MDRIAPGRATRRSPASRRRRRSSGSGSRHRSSGSSADRGYVVDSPRFRVADPPNYTTFVTFQSQDGLDDRIEYTAGRPPARAAAVGRRRRARPSSRSRSVRGGCGRDAHRPRRHAAADASTPAIRSCATSSRARPARPRSRSSAPIACPSPTRTPTGSTIRGSIRAAVGGTVDNPIAYVDGRHRRRTHTRTSSRSTCRRPIAGGSTSTRPTTDAGQLDALVPDLRRLKTEFECGRRRRATPSRTCGPGCGAVVDRYLQPSGRRPRPPSRSRPSDRWPWRPGRSASSPSSSSGAGVPRSCSPGDAAPRAASCWARSSSKGCW